MKKLIPLIVFVLTGYLSFAQPSINTDSLRKVLATEATDSITLKKYLVLAAGKLQTNNTEAKLIILDWLIAVSKEKKYQQYEANGYYWKGVAYFVSGNANNAVEWYTKALEFSHNISYVYIENNCNIGLGGFYFNNKQYDKALPYFEKAVEISKKNNFTAALTSAYLNIANVIYGSTKHLPNPNYNEVIRYMKLSLEVAEKRQDTIFLIKANVGIGAMYNLKKEYPLSENYMKQAAVYLAVSRWDYLGSNFYGNLGEIYKVQNKYKEAIENYKKGLISLKKYPDPSFEYKIYASLAESYQATGDYENAYKFQLKYSSLHDSLLDKEKFSVIADLENKYQQALKDKEINRLSTEQKIKQLELEKQKAVIAGNFLEAQKKGDEILVLSQQKDLQALQISEQDKEIEKNTLKAKADAQQMQLAAQDKQLKEKQISNQKQIRNLLITGLSLLSLLSVALLRNISSRKKAYRQLETRNIEIKEKALQLSKQAKLIAKFQSQMNPHFTFNALHSIYGLVVTNENDKAVQQIQSLATLMRQTLTNSVKEEISLEEEIKYLQKYIDFEKATSPVIFDFKIEVDKQLEGAVIPPMMIQPFIENAVKHAELDKVKYPFIRVIIEKENDLMKLIIEDNGQGLNKDNINVNKLSHSMSIIKSRVELLFENKKNIEGDSFFKILSTPEIANGTAIKFYLPLNYAY